MSVIVLGAENFILFGSGLGILAYLPEAKGVDKPIKAGLKLLRQQGKINITYLDASVFMA